MEESEGLSLDEFLNRLYQCGEAAVNETKNRKGKAKLKGTKCKQNKNEEQTLCSEVQPVPCSTALPTTSDSAGKTVATSTHRIPKCLVKLRAELLNSMTDCAMQAKAKEENNGSVINSEQGPVEVVTFTGSRKRKKPAIDKDKVEETVEQNNTQQKVFSLQRARLEVHKFGLTGYRKEQQRVFERERAIMLGARPPKREYVNYKTYQEMIKNKAAMKLMEMNSKSTHPKRKKEERRNRKSEIIPTGQVGRFKDGALILSDRDIKKIKRTKSKHM